MTIHQTTRSAIAWLTLMTLLPMLLMQSVIAAGPDLDAPVIRLPAQAPEYLEGDGYRIEATVTDANGLAQVNLMIRSHADQAYQPLPMQPVSGNQYRALIPESQAAQSGMDYYIEARDNEGNTSRSSRPSEPEHLAKVEIKPPQKAPVPAIIVSTPVAPMPTTTETPPGADLPGLGAPATHDPQQKPKSGTWKYILLGVLGAALVAGAASSGGSGGGDNSGGSTEGGNENVTLELNW